MKRRNFLTRGAAVVTGAVALPAVQAQEPAPATTPVGLVTSPAVIMAAREDGCEIVWSVSRLAKGWIELKQSIGTPVKIAADAFGMTAQNERVLRIRIEGLKRGTAYEFRTITEAVDGQKERVESAWKPFKTLDATASATSFMVWNDTHQNAETLKRLTEYTPQADFLLWNGDICNDWHQESLLAPTLLNPGGQDITRNHPLFFTWGNHDVRGKWAYKLKDYAATPDGRPFHAFRSGPVACVCLHTGEDKPDDHPSFGGRVAFDELRAQQAKWLAHIIEQPEFKHAPYRVVFCHIPLRWTEEKIPDYAAGGYDGFSIRSRAAWHESLVKWKTQLVISGHTHRTAWIPATQEFPYAQLVGGGPKPEAATIITGNADRSQLKIVMRKLDGQVVREVAFKALS